MSAMKFRRSGRGRHSQRRQPKSFLHVEQLEARELLAAGLSTAAAQAFVTGLYHDFLRRVPGAAEVNSWVQRLATDLNTQQVALGFTTSVEYENDVVQQNYHALLGRTPSSIELSAGVSLIQANQSDFALAERLSASDEYYADQGGSDTRWLTSLYQNFLHRLPDASGLGDWTSRLQTGTSRQQVASGIIQSTEAMMVVVTTAYNQLLHRDPDGGGLHSWVSALTGGTPEAQVQAAIAGSAEYIQEQLAGPPSTPTQPASSGSGSSSSGSAPTTTGSTPTLTNGGTASAGGTSTAPGQTGTTPVPSSPSNPPTGTNLPPNNPTSGNGGSGTGSGSGSGTGSGTGSGSGSGTGSGTGSGSGSSTGSGSGSGPVSVVSPPVIVATLSDPAAGLTIPMAHARLWWTPARLAQAQSWYASHPVTPDSDDPWANALNYVLTGNAQYGRTAVNLMLNFTLTQAQLASVAVDDYRWADWVPVVYDWCYNLMTPTEASTFMTRYNSYVATIMAKPWGGPGMDGNNYYWGYFRNEVNWAIATWYENPMASTFLADALVTRWQNSFLPWAAASGADGARGGVTPEGSQYGRYMLQYNVMSFTSLKLLGRDLLQETNFFKEAAIDLIYSTTPSPVSVKSSPVDPYYGVFPFEDDETGGGYPDAQVSFYGDFMTMIADEWSAQPVGELARQWLNTVAPPVDAYVACVDTPGQTLSFSSLPTAYYAPGANQYFYTRSDWSPQATSVLLQMGEGGRQGHGHLDVGTFQIVRGDQWLSKESAGYYQQFNGFTDHDTAASNGILFQGMGEANAYADGPATVLRLQDTATYSYAAVDLSNIYRAHNSSHPLRDDNPYAGGIIREFIFIKPLQTLLVLDRLANNTVGSVAASSVQDTFLLHVPLKPVVTSGNSILEVNGDQALRMTSLLTANPDFQVIDEGAFTGHHLDPSYYQYSIEESVSGSAQNYFLHAIQTRAANGTDVTLNLTETATSWTITLDHPTLGHAIVTLNKGMTSTGGTIGYSPAGLPTSTAPLATTVQQIQVTNNGVTWS